VEAEATNRLLAVETSVAWRPHNMIKADTESAGTSLCKVSAIVRHEGEEPRGLRIQAYSRVPRD